MNLSEKLLKNSKTKGTAVLQDSSFFDVKGKDNVVTDVPGINVALSGELNRGLHCGLLTIAGKSKHFKTMFSLIMAAAFLRKHSEGMLLFYDSEFGSPQEYFSMNGIDTSRVIHTPISNIEELKFDIVNQLQELEKKDKVMIIIDSIGNLASLKETEDAQNSKSVSDMSRAKALKSLFRIVTPSLMIKDIPLVAINHVYSEISLYPKDIVSGGTGIFYSSNDIWIVNRQQEKEASSKEILGYNFTINIEKSRTVKEKSKINVKVLFDGGIYKWSGLFDFAMEFGFLHQSKVGWYQKINFETGEILEDAGSFRKAALEEDDEFWKELIANEKFQKMIEKKYKLVQQDKEKENTSE